MKIESGSAPCFFPVFSPVFKRFNSFIINRLDFFYEGSHAAWEQIKSRFAAKSETDLYLEKLENAESIDWEKEADRISKCIAKVNPYTPTGIRLKKCIAKCPSEKRQPLVEAALEDLLLSKKGSLDLLYKLFDNSFLEGKFGSAATLIEELRQCLPPSRTAPLPSFWPRLGKILRVVSRFFPRFMDILLKAFNLIEVGKGPETPWDFYAVLSIYFKLFMIPYALFASVAALVAVPAQALLISGAILLLIVTGVCIYIRWRPVPQELPRAKNLSEEVRENASNWVGREDEVSQLLESIGSKEESRCLPILIKGASGVGKTELVREVARRCKEKIFFLINTPQFVDGYTPLEDKIGLLLLDLKGHEREVVLVFEEFGDVIAKKQKNLGGCLKPLMDRKQIQIIALTTDEEYKSIQEDHPLNDKFGRKIEIKAPDKEQVLKILQKRIASESDSLLFDKNVAEAIYAKTEQLAQPRAAVNLLEKAVQTVRFNVKHQKTQELVKTRDSLTELQSDYEQALSLPEETSAIMENIQKMKKEVRKSEENHERHKREISSLERLSLWRKAAKQQLREAASHQQSGKPVLFIRHILLPWLHKKMGNRYKVDLELIKNLE